MTGSQEPLAVLKSGFAVDVDVGICRRLTGTSCPSDGGVAPPTLVDVVHALGPAIAPTVVVEVGYNEFADTFPQSVEAAITTLLGAGVTKILWLTLADGRPQYVPMTRCSSQRPPAIRSSSLSMGRRLTRPRLVVSGRQRASHLRRRPGDGAAVARCAHGRAGTAAHRQPDQASGRARRQAVLGATQSARRILPYRWRLTSGALPAGLHLLASGRLTGTPYRSRKLGLSFRITDAVGQTTRMSTTITIAGR